MGCGCKKKKVEGEVVKVETGAPEVINGGGVVEEAVEQNEENKEN